MRLHAALALCLLASLAPAAFGHAVAGAQKSLRAGALSSHEAGSLAVSKLGDKSEETELEEDVSRFVALLQLATGDDMPSSTCKNMFLVILVIACCSTPLQLALQGCFGEKPAIGMGVALLGMIVTVGVLIHTLNHGMPQKVIDGGSVTGWCLALSIWAIVVSVFYLFYLSVLCCLLCCMGVAMAGAMKLEDIKNKSVRKVREHFDTLSEDLTPEMKTYYNSQEFKDKCDDLFVKADKDGNGKLDMCELRETVLCQVTDPTNILADVFFIEAFDDNGNSEIEKDEFYELMKYFDMVYRNEKGTMLGATGAKYAPEEPQLKAIAQ